jgi:hypothetical protein
LTLQEDSLAWGGEEMFGIKLILHTYSKVYFYHCRDCLVGLPNVYTSE